MNRRLCIFSVFLLILLSLSTFKISADELIDTSTFTDSNSNASLDSLSLLARNESALNLLRSTFKILIYFFGENEPARISNGSVLLGNHEGATLRSRYFFTVLYEEIIFPR